MGGPHTVIAIAGDEHIRRTKRNCRTAYFLLVGKFLCGMGKDDLLRSVINEILSFAMDQPSSDIDLFKLNRFQVVLTGFLEHLPGNPGSLRIFRDHPLQHLKRSDIRHMGIFDIAIFPKGPEKQDVGFYRMR